jgi:hypothetical protein
MMSGATWIAVLVGLKAAHGGAGMPIDWRLLQPGVEYAAIAAADDRGGGGGTAPADGRLHVVRIDPARAPVQAVMASAGDGRRRTAGEWCRARGLSVAINMGMYRQDGRTNVGYARQREHVNNGRWVRTYRSVLGLGASRPGLPPAMLLDLPEPESGLAPELVGYETVVQNLRLISAPGRGMWAAQPRRWSEAAVAIDQRGRILFVFSRRAHSMQEFNRRLLSLPLDVSAAMHVEGGPEASLSIHAGGVDLDLGGSYETGFNENDDERAQWPLPNVLGVARRR